MEILRSLNWKEIGVAVSNLPRYIIQWVTSLIEFIVDHLHGSIGHLFIMASPLMAPAPSAIAIYGALADRFGHGNAMVMTFVFEALGFASVYIKTRLEQHNRSRPASMQPLDKANIAVTAYFVVTEVSILGFEVIPAWAQWFSDGDLVTALRHTAPLIFPVFSYIGANIYSMMDTLTAIETEEHRKVADEAMKAKADDEERKANYTGQIASLEAKIAKLQDEQAAALGVLESRSEDLNRTKSERLEAEKEAAILRTQVAMLERQLSSVENNLERFQEHSLTGGSNGKSERSAKRSATVRADTPHDKKRVGQVAIVTTIRDHGSQSYAELGRVAGVSKTTAAGYVSELLTIGALHREDLDDGSFVLSVNGNHEQFLAGKIR